MQNKPRILYVDNDPNVRMLIRRLLASFSPLAVDFAADATYALSLLIKNKYDLVLTDVNLPDFSGIWLLEKIRGNIDLKTTKVVALTADAGLEYVKIAGFDRVFHCVIDIDRFPIQLVQFLVDDATVTMGKHHFFQSYYHGLSYFQDQDKEILKKIDEQISLLKAFPSWEEFTRIPLGGWKASYPFSQIVPDPNEVVWFIDESKTSVFEATIHEIEKFVSKYEIIQYYLIAQDFSWAIAKNHQNKLFAVGDVVEKNLQDFLDKGSI